MHCALKLLKFNDELLLKCYVEHKDQKALMLVTVPVLFTQVAQISQNISASAMLSWNFSIQPCKFHEYTEHGTYTYNTTYKWQISYLEFQVVDQWL